MSVKWLPLQDGDVVDIVAPGYATDKGTLKAAGDFLKSWGLRPRYSANIFGKNLLFSNSDEQRFKQFKKALLAKDSKIIWCLRGGYGTLRLLPELAKLSKPKQSKLLIGISDISSLHSFLNNNWQWPSLHASLLDRLASGKLPTKITNELQRILFGQQDEVLFKNLKPMNKAAKKIRRLNASVVGGNLTVLQSTIGTPFALNLKNRFIFLEDLGERGYRLDRMLVHMSQAGYFKNCRGILFGQFTGGNEPNGKNLTQAVLRQWSAEQNIPVFSGVQSGHDINLNSLPFATSAVLEKKDGYSLRVMTGAKK